MACPVCSCRVVRTRTVTSVKWPDRQFTVRICAGCSFVANLDNTHDYGMYHHADELPMRSRVGRADRPGREFHMGQMAADILELADIPEHRSLDVLIYGAGRSLDNVHLGALPRVASVAISDIMQVREDADFVDSLAPVSRRFDIVIASEVVEHFLDPAGDFAKLLDYVSGDGLLICSTNLYDGTSLRRHNYLFLRGHVSYFTEAALEVIRRDNGFLLDLRVPLVATGYGGPRKRYLLFTRSHQVLDAIATYFQGRDYAPSEPPTRYADDPRVAWDRAAAGRRAGRTSKAAVSEPGSD